MFSGLYIRSNLFFAVVMSLLAIIFSNNVVFCQSITSFTCLGPVATPAWPRNNFINNCTIVINRAGRVGLKVGVYATSYNTTKVSGNGPTPLDYRQPETPDYRFKADGPLQGGTPANITTNATVATGITLVKNNINTDGDANFSFNINYRTYEADYGDTNYTQVYRVRVFRSTDVTAATTANQSYNFQIANKQYITVSAPPDVTLSNSAQVFTLGQYYDSNSLTVAVKANNTWKLQLKLAGDPTDATKTIPVASNYFYCSGAGFINLAPTRTSFALANTYYDAAQNNAGVYRTGTADNINLSSVNVTTLLSLRTTNVFDRGNYLTTATFNVISP